MARYGADEIDRLIERIRRRKPDGWTALYDAVGVYLNGVGPLDGQKIMLLYTDGGDTRSELTFSDLLDLLKSSDVTVYAIGYLENQPGSARTQGQTQLQRMASITGGQAFFPSSVKELDKIYEKIQREIAARYSLGYLSSDTRKDGAWRKVEIKLKRQDLKGAKLRTRTGYFAPFKPRRHDRPHLLRLSHNYRYDLRFSASSGRAPVLPTTWPPSTTTSNSSPTSRSAAIRAGPSTSSSRA